MKMKKTGMHKLLSALLIVVLLFGIILPSDAIISSIAADNLIDYTISDFSKLESDGWISTHFNGNETEVLSGETYLGHGVSDGGKSAFWQVRTTSDLNFVRLEGSKDCEDGCLNGNISALTYKEAVTDFEFQFDTQLHSWHSQAMISIGVQNPGELYSTSDNVISLITECSTNSNKSYSGKFTIYGKALTEGVKTFNASGDGWKTFKLKVYANTLEIFVNGGSLGKVTLNSYWRGGKISIMSNNAYARYANISLKELETAGKVICRDYDGEDKSLSLYTTTDKFGDLPIPTRDGCVFLGFYKDSALTVKANDDEIVYGLDEIWAKWSLPAENTYDETNIQYNSSEYEKDSQKIKYISRDFFTDGDLKLSEYSQIAKDKGINNTNAVLFTELRGSSESDKNVSYLRIYETTNEKYPFFITEENSKYKVSLTYKIENSNESVDFILRKTGKYGKIGYDDEQLVKINSEDTVKGEWKTISAEFTSKKEEAIYIAIVSSSGNADTTAEIYIDDVIVYFPEDVQTYDYENDLSNLELMEEDGWKASYSSNPSAGEAFVDCEVTDYLLNASGGIQRNAKDFDWRGDRGYNNWKDPFYYMSALTYTGQQYKYFTLSVDYRLADPTVPWPIVSFGQQSATAEMFYSPTNVNANPAGGETPIGVFPELEGSINIKGKNVAITRKAATAFSDKFEWHTLTITVTPGKVDVSIDDGVVTHSTTLSENYTGGYISLMLGHCYSMFKNLKVTKLNYEQQSIGYSSSLSNLNTLEEDGWKASYSSNPSAGEPFVDCEVTDYLLNASGGIQRNAKDFDHSSIHGYGNWKDPFYYMSALTYTSQQYKYFTLSVDYMLADPTVPWPIVSFGQQSATAEMFYSPTNVNANPAGGETPIGVYPELEGSVNIKGKNVAATRKPAAEFSDKFGWHTLTITVTPGKVDVSIDNGVVTHSTTLSENYTGGYISLMLGHCYSMFKNFSVTEYGYLDGSQEKGVSEKVFELSEEYSEHPFIIKIKPTRQQVLSSLSVVTDSGKVLEAEKVSANIYRINEPVSARVYIRYDNMELDYDPEYTLKYYFDWEEELDDFSALRTSHPDENALQKVEVTERWKISDNILSKPDIDVSDTAQTGSYFADLNILLLDDIKFRNFELTVQYKHGRSGGYAGGIIFGIKDSEVFCDQKDGGIFAMVESDARATLYGKSLKNADVRLIPGEGVTNLPGYPKWDTTQIHTMKLRVLDGRVEMIVDDANAEDPVIGMIPKDYYGYIALAVANNKGWFDNLTIQPLDEWGNKITLAENEKQSVYNPDDIETDVWIDNSKWLSEPIDYFE